MEGGSFFVPSYLRRSRYVERLEGAWRRSQLRERGGGVAGTFGGGREGLSRTGSHSNLNAGVSATKQSRGVVQDVIERLPPLTGDEGLRALPSRWSETDKCYGLEIMGSTSGMEVKYQGTVRTPDDAAAVRSDVPVPREVGVYYFEVTVLSRGKEGLIGIGFSSGKPSLNRLPGWELESWGYHGDDGFSFACSASGKPYGPKFSSLDVVGCGINFRTGTAFFTKNGIFLGEAFHGIKPLDRLYPSVGIKKPGEHLRANFGQSPFVFDIDSLIERERLNVLNEISRVDTSNSVLRPGLDETDTIHELISQYLAHEGFIESANQFAQDVRQQKRALQTGDASSGGPDEPDDLNAVHRQKVRAAILDGDIDNACKYLGTYFPHVLDQELNRDIYFRLRCRKFIEMILRSYEMQSRVGSPAVHSEDGFSNGTNGHNGDGGAPLEQDDTDMDLDGAPLPTNNGKQEATEAMDMSSEGIKDTPAFADSRPSALLSNDLLNDAITYGMELQGEFSHDTRPEVQKSLKDTFALIAYNDARDSVLADMMEGKGRVEIAEQVNGAILVSLGKPRSALLEKLCAQTSILLEMLSEDGGAGAFVNLQQDFLR
ncbi:concanavalin A-like lectin/glucanase domain-containing protein [Elsinoe ampelina]|uniref:Concanavalin A-like lectin/glucanase domain-containing protein n=1 Tax=Elsinoe ampelina TaxID=302913 RepID=A0A6A6G066_9PEZI|nr:concanavalin A-like lectin/glucanase domain-containing protein [Elsinoe ampelina]